MRRMLDEDGDTFDVSNKRYLPRKKEFVGQPSRYFTFECDRASPREYWTE